MGASHANAKRASFLADAPCNHLRPPCSPLFGSLLSQVGSPVGKPLKILGFPAALGGKKGLFCRLSLYFSLTWGVSGQAHSLRRPLACHPRSGAKRSGAGSEATLTRQRPDTLVARERALTRSRRPLRSLPRSFILTLRISFCRSDPKREPGLAHAALPAASPHIRSSLVGSHHNPSCSRASGSGWRDHPFSRRVSARGDPRSPPARIRRSRRVQLRWNGVKPSSHQAIRPSGHQAIRPSLERWRGIEPSVRPT